VRRPSSVHYLSRVRRAFLLPAALLACGGDATRTAKAPPGVGVGGPDAVLLRLPREGGVARAFRWGSDSVLWSSRDRVPPIRSVLAFDDEAGVLVYVDARGQPGRLDLRVGSAGAASAGALSALASADGWAVFGVSARREVTRVTPSGTWSFPARLTPRALLPLADGSLVLVNDLGERTILRRLYPPESRVTDTTSVPRATLIVPTALGDRVYFAGDSGLSGLRARDLARTPAVRFGARVQAAAPTPSGDRLFVALEGRSELAIVDRYEERPVGRIDLPAPAVDLRMDSDGRTLLARPDLVDSVIVISVGSERVERVLPGVWRDDLPLAAPDGGVLVSDVRDAVLLDGRTARERLRFAGGAGDVWALIRWNGFRPRAAGLDQPVSFAEDSVDTTAVRTLVDSILRANVAPPAGAQPPAAAVPPPPLLAPERAEPRAIATWTLSFAAMLDERRARELAASIRVDGRPVRVVPTSRDGVPIFRVVYGPFTSRDEAERAGVRTGLPFWVYEGPP
jgi:cell division septation protein DedD